MNWLWQMKKNIKLTEQLEKIQEQLKDSEIINHEIKVENDSLRDKVIALEEKASQKIKEAQTEVREAERIQQNLHIEIKTLQKKIKEQEEDLLTLRRAESVEKDISGSKAAFRIDFYPQPEGYQGKIRNLLTTQTSAFIGLDQSTIMKFMSGYLEKLKNKNASPKNTVIEYTKKTQQAPVNVYKQPRIIDIKTKPLESNLFKRSFSDKQRFDIILQVDSSKVKSDDLPLKAKATAIIKKLGSKERNVIGEIEYTLPSTDIYPITIESRPLPVGHYRLEAIMTFTLPKGDTAPYADDIDGGLLYVQ